MSTLNPQRGEQIPRATPSSVTQPFWEGCKRGELLFQRCGECGKPNFTPVERCRGCLGAGLEWQKSAGTARLISWTVVWRPAAPSFSVPYVPAVVELAEGYQMMTNIVGCEPDALRGGMALRVSFHAVDDTLTLPYFRPA
jgi:uncharacterized OB-fold protein